MGAGAANDVACTVTAALMFAGVVYKLARTGRPDVDMRMSYAILCCIVSLSLAIALQIRLLSGWVDAVVGRHSTVLVAEALAMSALCSYQIAMVLINDPNPSGARAVRRRCIAGAASISSVATLFVLSSSRPTPPGMAPPQDDPFGFAMETVFVLYVAFVSVDVARLALRFARLGGDRDLLRLSIYGMAVNAFVVLAYAAAKLAFLAALTLIGTAVFRVQYKVTVPLIVAAALLAVIFATLPSWGRLVGADQVAARFGRYITHLALYPLWRDVAMDRPTLQRRSRWADRLLPSDIDFRLTRRVIEIHDGLLALAPYRDHGAHAAALAVGRSRGIDGVELEAAAEAASIAVAVERRRSGVPYRAADGSAQIEDAGAHTHRAVRIADDVKWLARVTNAYQSSAVVRPARNRWSRDRSMSRPRRYAAR